ncbi:MAG: ATP synthase F1 subunit epsilon [Oscillospiraceae bacterium]|jgi:F-type H+-transporting ATPase subunit epsilon|nr:ATP synthase F1 subunit epsilon [Oscillospiraceae bacterium]
MATFHLQIVTPNRMFFNGEAEKLVVRTAEGDIGVLHGHTHMVAPLGIGPMEVYLPGEKPRLAAIANGFVKVGPESCTLVAITCEWAEEIDVDRAQRAKAAAEETLKAAQGEREQDVAELKLKRALNRISVSGR